MATKPDRSLRRAAERIHELLSGSAQQQHCLPLPEHFWQHLRRVVKLLGIARERRWRASEQRLLPRVSRLLGETIDELSKLRASVDAQVQQRERPTLGNTWREVVALPGEFDDVRYDVAGQRLSAVTPPITLDGVELGSFEICLELSKLGSAHPYRIVALEPSPAATNSSVPHPHVQDESLCEGEGRSAIRRALEQGRVYDFFVLVRQILETYNPGSAYVALDDWHGVSCRDCGYLASLEESGSCDYCGRSICSDCSRGCGSCWRSCCAGCSSSCNSCDSDTCPVCMRSCEECEAYFCNKCISGGQCESCRSEEDDHDEETEDSGADSLPEAPTEAEIHAVCLVEAAVSPGSG